MSSLHVRCRSCTTASTAELTEWLEQKVEELRADSPELLVRLTRLVQDLPDGPIDDGWMVEIQSPEDRAPQPLDLALCALPEILRDMRILGLDPTLLASRALPLAAAAFAAPGCPELDSNQRPIP